MCRAVCFKDLLFFFWLDSYLKKYFCSGFILFLGFGHDCAERECFQMHLAVDIVCF